MNKKIGFTLAGLMAAASLMAGCASTTDLSVIPVKVSKFGSMSTLRQQTLYTYGKDIVGSGTSNCDEACGKTWRSFLAGPQDVPSGDFSLIARNDGSRQWVYKGQPLYFFAGDGMEVDVHGSKGDDSWRYPYIYGGRI